MFKKVSRAEIETIVKDRLVIVKFTAHVDVLRTLPREHEDHRRCDFVGDGGYKVTTPPGSNCAPELTGIFDNLCATEQEFLATNLAGEGNVSQIELGVLAQVGNEIVPGMLCRGFSLRRDR